MNIVITHGTGFIGQTIADLYAAKTRARRAMRKASNVAATVRSW